MTQFIFWGGGDNFKKRGICEKIFTTGVRSYFNWDSRFKLKWTPDKRQSQESQSENRFYF